MTTPALVGNVGSFTLSGANLSGDGNQIKFAMTQDLHEASVFGDTWKEYVAGLASATLDFNGYYDAAAGKTDQTVFPSMVGVQIAAAAFVVNPIGGAAASGKPTFTGNCYLNKYDVDVKVNAAITFALSFRVNGTLVRGVL